MSRILVCGSRDWDDPAPVAHALCGYLYYDAEYSGELVVIQGGAKGADELALKWAQGNECAWLTYPADWKKHGKAAGPIRNQQMLDEGKPDVVWAFVTRPLEESRGTADMVRRATAAGVPTYVVWRA
jgi:hypothetical protein